MKMSQLPFFEVYLTVLISLFTCNAIHGFAVKEEEQATLSCNCRKSNVTLKLDTGTIEYVFGSMMDSNSSNTMHYPQMIRDILHNCSSCEITFLECDRQLYEDNNSCQKSNIKIVIHENKTYHFEDYEVLKLLEEIASRDFEQEDKAAVHVVKRDTAIYPIYSHIPIGGLKKRFKRQSGACHHPTRMHTYQLDCVYYPQKVKCTQQCAHGHTHPNKKGQKIVYTCKKKENKWKPNNFAECKPFVDCTITLVSGGKASCTSHTLKKGPVCTIKCEKYEDKKETKKKKYSCDNKGKWSPKLPFCAHPGSGLELEAPPGQRSDSFESVNMDSAGSDNDRSAVSNNDHSVGSDNDRSAGSNNYHSAGSNNYHSVESKNDRGAGSDADSADCSTGDCSKSDSIKAFHASNSDHQGSSEEDSPLNESGEQSQQSRDNSLFDSSF